MSVEWAKKNRKKWEEINRLRPNALNAMNLACIYHTLAGTTVGLDGEAGRIIDMVYSAIKDTDVPQQILAQTIFNRGMFHRAYGRVDEADMDISAAWALEKSSDYIAMAMAETHLRKGEWQEGWKIHNRARGTVEGAAQSLGLTHDCKFWDGTETPTHLMVINEGGTGDRINYTRYLPLLTERGIPWSFFCFDELKPFYDRLPWIGPSRTIGESAAKEFSPPPSHWTTTFALAGPLGVDPDAIPCYPTPFTAPDHDLRFVSPDGLPFVGLNWSANELFQGGLKCRSLTEGQAMRLVSLTADKIHWVNLQHGHKMPFPVTNVAFDSWQDTACVIDALDAVVTVDSGPLWLSLAMQKETACILGAFEDWKFAHNWGKDCTIFRNGPSESFCDMEKAIDSLILAIRREEFPKQPLVPSDSSTTTRTDMALVA